MSTIHIPTILTRPEKEWESLLRESEEERGEELRSDDRTYLVRALRSDVCQRCDPTSLLRPAPQLLFALTPHPHDGIPLEKERAVREEVAQQMLVILGLFPALLIRDAQTGQRLLFLAEASGHVFAHLGRFIRDDKERRRNERFSEDLFRYVDILLALHERVYRERLPHIVLFILAQAGSTFAKEVLSPRARHH